MRKMTKNEISVTSAMPGRYKGWKSKLNKRNLMLSAGVIAILATPASASSSTTVSLDSDDICVADNDIHCITSKTTSALTTSTATGVDSAAGPSNIYMFYDSDNGYGRIVMKKANTALITIDSDNYVYSNGVLSNTASSGAQGIRVDLSANPDTTTWTLENYELDTITGAAIYLDASSTMYLTGDGSSKVGIWLDPSDSTTGTGTLTGDIITYYGSVISIKGDDSIGILMDQGATLDGNIQLSGTLDIYQHKPKSMTESNLFGLYMNGYVNGSVGIYDGGTVLVAGSGANGFFISGSGVSGNITIEGTLATEGIDSSSVSSTYYTTNSNKIYPDAGPALTINSSIGKGIEITGLNYDDDSDSTTGTVSTVGTEATILISPVVVTGGTTYTASSSVVVGLYQSYSTTYKTYSYEAYDPGFGLYNRGTVSLTPTNVNYSVGAALRIEGTSALPTYINGGIFNSGSISAAATTDEKYYSVTATAVSLEGNVYVGGYYDTATGTYYEDAISCTGSSCTYESGIPDSVIALMQAAGSAVESNGRIDPDSDNTGYDQAAFVNSGDTGSGKISATISGKGGGTATALLISADSHLSSIYNSGTISATATTTHATITSTLAAYAIHDLSGSLTYIYNAGTIAASATSLDSDLQIADAINLISDNSSTAASSGVTIINAATSDASATITGAIRFDTGDNQQIYLTGASSSYLSAIVGSIYYGACSDGGSSCGDVLSIGAFGEVSGQVVSYGSDIAVTIYNNGLLYLQNGYDKDSSEKLNGAALTASTLTVYDGGYLSLGIKEDSGLNSSGYIQASGDVNIYSGANFGVAYNSYIGSESGSSYVLLTTTGTLNIEDFATYAHDISTPMTASCDNSGNTCGDMPFLFASQSLTTKTVSNSDGSTTSELVLTVTTKTASELGLTGYAKQMFSQINYAISTDDELGAAMVNGIHANVDDTTATGKSYEAQKAYDAYAPNASGGTRAIALSITDQATGVVAARQRSLRMFAKEEGELTLWTQEFVQSIKNPGQGAVQEDGSREKTGFRDHGFGVVVGMDAGSPENGWYGGALTFYNGDVSEIQRTSHENQMWFVATGYGTWRGKGLFFDGKVDLGYAHIKGLRYLHLETGTGDSQTSFVRYAQNAHSAAMMSGGFTTGATFTYSAFTFLPQLSVDALFLRENGYTEFNPVDKTPDADGFSLTVKSHYAKSLRAFLGSSVRYDLDLLGVFLQPELRAGYRYDFLNDPTKLKAAFKDLEPDTTGNQSSSYFTIQGPDPSQGNFVLGTSVSTTSGAWSLGLSYDYIRGTGGNLEQVATFNLIGRI